MTGLLSQIMVGLPSNIIIFMILR